MGDDGRGSLEHELAERSGAGLGDGDAEGTELLQERTGAEGLAGTAAGNSQEQAGLAAVFMFARLAASSVSIAANGSGTGAAALTVSCSQQMRIQHTGAGGLVLACQVGSGVASRSSKNLSRMPAARLRSAISCPPNR